MTRSHPPGNENAKGSNTILLSSDQKKVFNDILSSSIPETTRIEIPSKKLIFSHFLKIF